MINFLCETTGSTGNDTITRIIMTVLLVAVMAGMLVMPYMSSKKRNREYEAMVNSLKAGDLVKTAGGIIGRIVKIMNKGEINTVILETGSKTEKSYMEFDLNMIYCILKSAKAENETEETEEDDEDELDDENDEVQNAETPVEEVVETVEASAEETAEETTEEKAEEVAEKKKETKTNNYKKAPIKKTTKKK